MTTGLERKISIDTLDASLAALDSQLAAVESTLTRVALSTVVHRRSWTLRRSAKLDPDAIWLDGYQKGRRDELNAQRREDILDLGDDESDDEGPGRDAMSWTSGA